jgi:thiamine monophosphate kinase
LYPQLGDSIMINLSFLDEKNKYIEHMEKIPPNPTQPHMCRLAPHTRAGRARAGACGHGSCAVAGEFITRPLQPEKRLAVGRALAKSQAVTAVMDNSDGLALSLSDLA